MFDHVRSRSNALDRVRSRSITFDHVRSRSMCLEGRPAGGRGELGGGEPEQTPVTLHRGLRGARPARGRRVRVRLPREEEGCHRWAVVPRHEGGGWEGEGRGRGRGREGGGSRTSP